MRVLALEPYYGGSHRAFLDRWIAARETGAGCVAASARSIDPKLRSL